MTFFRNVFGRVWADIKTKKMAGVVAVVLASVFFWLYGLNAGLLWLLFLLFFVYEWENYIIGVLALIMLALCPVLLLFNQNTLVKAMTVDIFFLLAMTVALQMVEYRRHFNKNAED